MGCSYVYSLINLHYLRRETDLMNKPRVQVRAFNLGGCEINHGKGKQSYGKGK